MFWCPLTFCAQGKCPTCLTLVPSPASKTKEKREKSRVTEPS